MVSAGLGQNSGLPVVGRLLKVSQETSPKATSQHSELVWPRVLKAQKFGFKTTMKVDLSPKRKFIWTNICLLIHSCVLRAKARARTYTRFWRYGGKWDSPCAQEPHCVREEKNVKQVTGSLLTSKKLSAEVTVRTDIQLFFMVCLESDWLGPKP